METDETNNEKNSNEILCLGVFARVYSFRLTEFGLTVQWNLRIEHQQRDHRSLTNGFAMAEIRGQISPVVVVPSHANRLPSSPFTMLGRIAL